MTTMVIALALGLLLAPLAATGQPDATRKRLATLTGLLRPLGLVPVWGIVGGISLA
jgi:hypothetical protein